MCFEDVIQSREQESSYFWEVLVPVLISTVSVASSQTVAKTVVSKDVCQLVYTVSDDCHWYSIRFTFSVLTDINTRLGSWAWMVRMSLVPAGMGGVRRFQVSLSGQTTSSCSWVPLPLVHYYWRLGFDYYSNCWFVGCLHVCAGSLLENYSPLVPLYAALASLMCLFRFG